MIALADMVRRHNEAAVPVSSLPAWFTDMLPPPLKESTDG